MVSSAAQFQRSPSGGNPMRILIVEDNRDIQLTLQEYFAGRGHLADTASDGLSGLQKALSGSYDVIVLDLMLPRIDGLELCRRLRQEAELSTPILLLTARDTLADKLRGFDSGADDYLVKPFALAELEARLKVLRRRSAGPAPTLLQVGELNFDPARMQASRAGQPLNLTPTGIKLLTTLMRAHPAVVSRAELERVIWPELPPDSDALRSHIHTLRQALDKPFGTPMLQTVHGVGFRLAGSGDA
jgi:DNA-binding response OmpR family regulator